MRYWVCARAILVNCARKKKCGRVPYPPSWLSLEELLDFESLDFESLDLDPDFEGYILWIIAQNTKSQNAINTDGRTVHKNRDSLKIRGRKEIYRKK